jgi:hypothetical protein
MSRALAINAEEIVKGIKKFVSSMTSLEANFHMMRMARERIELKRFGLLDSVLAPFSIKDSFPSTVLSKSLHKEHKDELYEGLLTRSQQAVLRNLSEAGRSLGYRQNAKALPYLGGAVVFEF